LRILFRAAAQEESVPESLTDRLRYLLVVFQAA
jgi:hypothetical protein